jgi:TFIIF-interacting CTD phosphatase-like protein
MVDLLVVLDLDETLLHARDEPLARPAELDVSGYHVYLRPGLEAFLDHVFLRFAVGVWTSSGSDYANAVIRQVFGHRVPRFLFTSAQCTQRRDLETLEVHWLKDIRKLRAQGFPNSRIVFVDDSPEKLARSYGNLIRVTPFEGDLEDRELAALTRYLDTLIDPAVDVRRIEKRGWQSKIGGR